MSNLQIFNRTITAEKTQNYLQQVLGENKKAFVTSLTSIVANNAALQACEPITLMYAGIKATALNLPLDPNLGFAYVIPYANRKTNTTEAQFQLGYKGLIQLAIRSGQFAAINVTDVREGELTDYDLLTGDFKLSVAANREALPIVGYAAYFRLTNGFAKSEYKPREEIESHAKTYSQTYSSKYEATRSASMWTKDFDKMAKKTILKLLLSKYAPLSIEMQQVHQAVLADQAVMRGENSFEYVDNDPTLEVDEDTANAVREKAKAVKDKVKEAMQSQSRAVEAEEFEQKEEGGE